MEKCFNTAGPCFPAKHYMFPALDRLPEIRRLVIMERYFVVHAPRQTGKTTALKALVREINAKGDMVALYCTLETLQNAKDPDKANRAIRNLLHIIREMALGSKRLDLCVEYRDKRYAVEVKTSRNFAGEDSYKQLAGYLGTLGLQEGWMAIFDEDQSKPWDVKLYRRNVEFDGKTLHIVGL